MLDVLGDRPLSSIRPSEVHALISGLEVAPSTSKVIAQHLRAVLRAAVRDGLIVKSPADDLRLPRQEKGFVVPLSDDEVAQLYEAAAPPFRAAVLLGAALGLRQAEASAITVEWIDFLRRELRVDRQLSNFGWGPPKMPASTREVPVAVPVIELLAQHLEQFGPGTEGRVGALAMGRARGRTDGAQPVGLRDANCRVSGRTGGRAVPRPSPPCRQPAHRLWSVPCRRGPLPGARQPIDHAPDLRTSLGRRQ